MEDQSREVRQNQSQRAVDTSRAGREVAYGLAGWEWPIVLVYLDHQALAEVVISEITAAGGTTVAVRAAVERDEVVDLVQLVDLGAELLGEEEIVRRQLVLRVVPAVDVCISRTRCSPCGGVPCR
jgi:hypothetical protein